MDKEAKELKKELVQLVDATERYIYLLDRAMKGSSTPERGKFIAKITNILQLNVDGVRYSALGIDYRKDKPFGERMAKKLEHDHNLRER